MSGLCFCDSAAQVLPTKILIGSISFFHREAYSIGGRGVKGLPASQPSAMDLGFRAYLVYGPSICYDASMRVSEYYNPGRQQPGIDFVNGDVIGDVQVFIDPRALRGS